MTQEEIRIAVLRNPSIRYVAFYHDGKLDTFARFGLANSSSGESDRYEELLVNPTLLYLAKQRGNIDCGGLRHLILRYGNFFQWVVPVAAGHVSVCLEEDTRLDDIEPEIRRIVEVLC